MLVPVFQCLILIEFIAQEDDVPAITVHYALDNQKGDVVVNLICNQTAPHDANVDFFVDGVIDSVFTISGYSYYGKLCFRE